MFCFRIFIDISVEWDALFVSNLIFFSIPVSDTVLKEKLNFYFERIAFLLGLFWYLDIVVKTSSPFPGVWQSKLFGTLRSKLGTKFSLNSAAISKSSVSSLPLSMRNIFSNLVDLSEKRLFMVF